MDVSTPSADPPQAAAQSAEQLRYARLLDWGARAGMVLLVVSFAAYVLGWLPALVPPAELPRMWSQPVGAYLQATGAPTGWGWVTMLGRGDMAGLAGIVLLASCSVPCLLAMVPLARARGDRRFAWLCVAEVGVIALAATGWFGAGH
ncbi:MAG: hypothetical protein JNJ89_05975 [Rubrivivax sp.]|nr:hypothetical protein [Rubrivivax sp.]